MKTFMATVLLGFLAMTASRAADAVTNNATLTLLSTSFTNRTYLVGTNQQTLVFTWHADTFECSRMVDLHLKSSKVLGFIDWSHTKSLQKQDVDALLTAVMDDLKKFLDKQGIREDDIINPRMTFRDKERQNK